MPRVAVTVDELVARYRPQPAVPVDRPPRGAAWVHELALGGERLGLAVAGGEARVVGPDGDDRTGAHPALAAALRALPVVDALLDGELVGGEVYALDLLWLDGRALTARPLTTRKARLARVIEGSPLRRSEAFAAAGDEVYRRACALGAGGVISKRADAPYGRAGAWRHTPCAPATRLASNRLFPAAGLDRADLIALYAEVADWVLPHVGQRPLTLVRCRNPLTHPDALHRQCVFVRHAPADNRWLPPEVPRLRIPEQRKLGDYAYVDSAAALLALLAHEVVELHVWNATVDDVERPDRIVLDLDPGEGASWSQVVEAARRVRAALAGLGLDSWPKSTGGAGLHVVVPFVREVSWAQAFGFSRRLAERLAAEHPGLTTAFERRQRTGKILIDYKRNHRTAIAVAPFSPRARAHAPIAVPLAWREVTARLGPDPYTARNLRQRLARLRADPWEGYARARQRLPAW